MAKAAGKEQVEERAGAKEAKEKESLGKAGAAKAKDRDSTNWTSGAAVEIRAIGDGNPETTVGAVRCGLWDA